jgi:hypothetical protein
MIQVLQMIPFQKKKVLCLTPFKFGLVYLARRVSGSDAARRAWEIQAVTLEMSLAPGQHWQSISKSGYFRLFLFQ